MLKGVKEGKGHVLPSRPRFAIGHILWRQQSYFIFWLEWSITQCKLWDKCCILTLCKIWYLGFTRYDAHVTWKCTWYVKVARWQVFIKRTMLVYSFLASTYGWGRTDKSTKLCVSVCVPVCTHEKYTKTSLNSGSKGFVDNYVLDYCIPEDLL